MQRHELAGAAGPAGYLQEAPVRDYDLVPGYPATGVVIATPDDVPTAQALYSRRFRMRHSDRVNEEYRGRYRKLRLGGMSPVDARKSARRAL